MAGLVPAIHPRPTVRRWPERSAAKVAAVYIPAHFKEDRIDVLHGFIRASSLATLVSMTADGMIASHAPLMLEPDPAPYGTLNGHLAKANPHARAADAGVQTLVIFQGADGYITPSYYAAKREHGKVVPTWNYAAVHAYGTLEAFDDPARLLEVVTRLTVRNETPRATALGGLRCPRGLRAGACCVGSSASRCRSRAWRAR